MAVTIVIEDGTGVTGANSYVTLDEVRAYAENRGIELDDDDDIVNSQLIIADDYLEALECEYQGSKADCDQALAWPRQDVVLCCEDFATDQIPKELKAAQCALVIAQHSGVVLFPNVAPSDYVIEEKVGPILTRYSDPAVVGIATRITGVESLLKPLFGSCEQTQFALRTVRV